ncbi:MAG: antibiotic biosynthesis monooxygenase [Syntrophaceae bacterium]|nr:antibiotic biosynthesis monooxygenase [Syntrophaceae bacterium]
MAAKVLIRRKVDSSKEKELLPLIIQLRKLAMSEPGYVSGETLKALKAPHDYLVISTWSSPEAWKAWEAKPERVKVQKKIDDLLGESTEYEVYHYPD